MSRKIPVKKFKGRPVASQQAGDARELLMKAAIPLFAHKGYAGTSVKDIADSAGVNISLISYHFGGKENLYKTCIENFGKNRLDATERILQTAQTREEARVRIEMFIDDILAWFDEEPDLCTLVQREADMNFASTRDVFENTFVKIFETFLKFIKSGQSKKYLRDDFDALVAAQFIFTGIVHITQKDEMTERLFGVSVNDPVYRKKLKTQITRIFFEGLGSAGDAKPNVRGVKK